MSGVNVDACTRPIDKFLSFQLALTVLFSGSALSLGFRGNSAIYIQIALVALAIVTIVYKYNGKFTIKRDAAARQCFSVLVIVLVSTLINISTFSPTVGGRTILSVLLAYLFMKAFDSGKSAIEAFVRVMKFFAITGFVCWVLFTVLGVPHTWMPTISSVSSNAAYHTIYIHNISLTSTRNSGPFWEPSIYAGYLMVGMVCSRFVLKQELKRLWPFILALLSTQSSGGIIMLFMFLIICLWDSYREDRETSFIVKILIVALLISSLFLWDVIQQLLLRLNYDMFSKIFNAMSEGQSETRLVSFLVDLQIWLESPIWGSGVSNMEVRFLALRDVASQITNMAHTSTSTEYIAAFGLGGFWINWLWLKGLFQKQRAFVLNVGIVAIFLVMLNLAPQINFVWPYFIMFALLQCTNQEQEHTAFSSSKLLGELK